MSVGTDVIVGFPGEGDTEFAHTKQTIGSLPISYMHIFPFSCRPGTPASTMPSQISAAVKKERFETLNALNSSMKNRYMSAQVNKILDIVIEERCPDNTVLGTSSNYVKVRAATDSGLNGSIIHVRITGTEGRVLRGNRIDSP